MNKLKNLINKKESDWLDFKSEWYEDKSNMILDILCFANSDAKSDRYIVIGYNEKNKEVKTPIENRMDQDELNDFLSKVKFNRIPKVILDRIKFKDQELDIITIYKTNYRPYFLLEDKKRKTNTIRAGVVYTRNASVNTAINSSASENQISDMWRERFGLNLTPFEQLKIYIRDTAYWKRIKNPFDDQDFFSYYYKKFPEFTISLKNKSTDKVASKKEFAQTIGKSIDSNYVIKYHSTILYSGEFTIMDNHRHFLIDPDIRFVWYKKDKTEVHVEKKEAYTTDTGYKPSNIEKINNNSLYSRSCFFYYIKNSLKYCLQQIIDKNAYERIYIAKIKENLSNKIYIINSEKEIVTFLRNKTLELLHIDKDPNKP